MAPPNGSGLGPWTAGGREAGPGNRQPSAPAVGSFSSGAGFKTDNADLQATATAIAGVSSNITTLTSRVSTLEAGLRRAAEAGKLLTSSMPSGKEMGQTGPGGSGNTSAPVTGGPSGTPGNKGQGSNTNTPAGFSSRAVGGAVAGEVAAGFAGKINTGLTSLSQGGMPIDLQAHLSGATFGGQVNNRFGGVSTAGYTAMMANSPQDLSQSIQNIQNNPWLAGAQFGKGQKQITKFTNAVQSMNPGFSGAQATQFADQLTSGPMMQAMLMHGGAAAGQGALINPRTGGVNNPGQAMKALASTFFGGRPMNAAQMKTAAANNKNWVNVSAQYGQGGTQGTNLSQQEINLVRQYMASGGSVGGAENAVGGSVAGTAKTRATATTQTKQDAYESTAGAQKTINNAMTGVQRFTDVLVKDTGVFGPAILSGAAVMAPLGAAALKLTATFLEANAMMKGLSGRGEAGLAGKAISKVKGIVKGGGKGAAADAAEAAGGVGGAGGAGAEAAGVAGGAALAPLAIGAAAVGVVGGLMYADNAFNATEKNNNPKQALGASVTNYPKTKKGQKSLTASSKAASGISSQTFHSIATLKISPQMMQQAERDMGTGGVTQGSSVPTPSGVATQGDPVWDIGDPHTPSTGSTSTMGLSPTMAKRVSAMQAANPNVKITSGHRTTQQQANLYALKGGRQVAKPGQSAHQTGQAADVGPASQFGWIAKNAGKFGLTRPAPKSEPWHLQAMGDPPASAGSAVTGSQVVAKAESYLGVPYSWGGGNDAGPTLGTAQGANTVGFDCSGFVMSVFSSFGIQLPRTSQDQASQGTAVSGIASAQPGDLLFYNYGSENDHVAIYIGNNQQVAAPDTGKTVEIENVDMSALSGIRRVIGGGAGKAVAGAAAAAAGSSGSSSSTTSGAGAAGTNVGLKTDFTASMSGGGWLSSGAGASAPTGSNGVGATSGTSSTAASATSSTTNGASGAAASTGSGSAAVVAAVKAATSNKNVQIAMLTGSYLESNQTPDDNGQNVAFGAFMIEPSENPVTQAQAEDPNFAAKYMEPAYAAGVNQEWGNNPKQISEEAAVNAAHDAERPAQSYFDSQPTRVGPAYALAVSEVGDPNLAANMASGPHVPAAAMSSVPGSSIQRGQMSSSSPGGGNAFHVHMPVQVVGVSQQDAQNLAAMAVQAMRGMQDTAQVGNT